MVIKRDRVVLSLKAKTSLHEIISYLKEHASPAISEHVRQGVIKKCKSLKNFSGFAKERFLDDLPEEYHSVCVWDYIIIYTISEKEVRILNIIHTHRHPKLRRDI